MKKIAIVFSLLFLLATVGVVIGETNSKEVVVYEKCRLVSCDYKGTIQYGIYDLKEKREIDEICAKGFLDLTQVLKTYEHLKGVKLQWSYRDKEQEHGIYQTPCPGLMCRNTWVS